MAEGCPWRQQGQHHADVEERLHNDHRSSWSRPQQGSGQSCRAPTVTLPALGVFATLHTIRKEPFLINYPCALPKLESHKICSIQHSTLARLSTRLTGRKEPAQGSQALAKWNQAQIPFYFL